MTIYETAGGLNPEEHRDIIIHRPVLNRILSHIENEDNYIALGSPRQTGKTTLLFQIQDCLHGPDYGVAYLDLSGLDNLDEADFYQAICADMCEQLDEMIENVEGKGFSPPDVTNQVKFCEFLLHLSSHTPLVRKLIVLFDEIEGVPGVVSKTLFPHLRSFFHRGRRPSNRRYLYQKVMFIFAGAIGLRRLMKGRNSPLKNICQDFSPTCSLDDLSKEQVGELVSKMMGLAPEKKEMVADMIYQWGNGHPYLTQVLCVLIEDSHECQRVSGDLLREVVKQLVENAFLYSSDKNLEHILNPLQEDDNLRQEDDEMSEVYRNEVFAIFDGERSGRRRRLVRFVNDLLSLGIIKRLDNNDLVIRNEIYRQALDNFFQVRGAL